MSETIKHRQDAVKAFFDFIPEDLQIRARMALDKLCRAYEEDAGRQVTAWIDLEDACRAITEYRESAP